MLQPVLDALEGLKKAPDVKSHKSSIKLRTLSVECSRSSEDFEGRFEKARFRMRHHNGLHTSASSLHGRSIS